MLILKKEVTLPDVGLTGFETPLSEEESAIQHTVHRFAKDVLRPLGTELDKMTAEQVAAPGSPYYSLWPEFAKLGLEPAAMASLPPETALRIESMISEELGWGDSGLAVSIGAGSMAVEIASSLGNKELLELSMGRIGCWIGTKPDFGSDFQIFDMQRDWPAGVPGNTGNLWGQVGKDEIVINGQSSAWVSNGAVAQVAVAYMSADYGDGRLDKQGRPYGVAAIVPLDLPGVTRGKPLEKIGQRALPQGEIYFDNVRIPKRFAIALKDDYDGNFASAWSNAGTHMAHIFTGVARAAFEHALQYCHERRQGGRLLIDHQLTRYRLGDMLRRIEMARATARRVQAFARLSPQTHPYITASGKVTATEEAMKVVHEAFQLFGGAGTTREYPIEKLFRDARSALIEDGENYTLTMRLGLLAQQLYAEGWSNP
ncbi:acyl-CoA dehydrogenase family protein [Burkholderia sp. BE17]|uniref:acyl-CoA dehydrogenase family protein n=1 Tax=Burkholderia sp. BE17 TaxID=2656644 RepID=UPI00128C26D7|nr:acyl-CoA dehydrogenase family protein [Burkholderia sp. BE17]MPV66813.1 acyl-CoA dehydrogenase [Burkholderia sp. BE17]